MRTVASARRDTSTAVDRCGTRARGRDGHRAAAGTDIEHGASGARMAPEVSGEHPRVAARREHSGQSHDPHGMSSYPDDPGGMRARFDAVTPLTVGLEEELMLVDPGTLDLLPRRRRSSSAPRRPAVQARAAGRPARDRAAADGDRRRERRRARHRAARPRRGRRRASALLAAAGAHPFAAPPGELNAGRALRGDRAPSTARRAAQLVCALQVHVAVGGADAHARGLQRPALAPARARRAGRQRAVLRRARQRARVRPPADRRAAAAPGRAARARELGACAEALRWGAARRVRRAAAVVVGAAPAPGATARSSCASPTRSRPSPTPPASRRSRTRSWHGWPRATTPATCPARRRRGGSRRTAGPRCRHGARRRALPTSQRARGRPRASGSRALLDALAPTAARARLRRASCRTRGALVDARTAPSASARRATRRRPRAPSRRRRASRRRIASQAARRGSSRP